jgi:hypothetical protein
VPDQAGMDGAKEIYRLVSELQTGDILFETTDVNDGEDFEVLEIEEEGELT